jgi:hypothetical protein
MQFAYEITVEDDSAGQMLYRRLLGQRRTHIRTGIIWASAGLFCLFIAWNQRAVDWPAILLTLIGVWWIYCALIYIFPHHNLRRAYAKSGLAGRRFEAKVDAEGFEVTDDLGSWHVRWARLTVKGEDSDVFVFYSLNTVFIFAKKYLTEEQQVELRRIAAPRML